MQPKKSLAELEQIYGRKMNLNNKPDLAYGDLKIDTKEFDTQLATKQKKNKNQEIEIYDDEIMQTNESKKEAFNEIRSFLPTSTEKMISSRYESPLKSLKASANHWRIFTIVLGFFGFLWFLLHLWATLSIVYTNIIPMTPEFILNLTILLDSMNDYLFDNDKLSITVDVFGLVIYITAVVKLIIHGIVKIESFDSKQNFADIHRKFSKFASLTIAVFGLVYLTGTIFALYVVRSQMGLAEMSVLIIYHSSKFVFLLLTVIAFRKYRSKNFIYEDLLLEALGNSSSGGDHTDEEESPQHRFAPMSLPSDE